MAFGQEPEYDFDYRLPGDSFLSLYFGTNAPLFNQDLGGQIYPSNISWGGLLGFDLDWHLNNNFKMGMSLKGLLSFSPNSKQLYMVPMVAKATYLFKQFPFSVPVSFGVGTVVSAFGESIHWDTIITPGVGIVWNSSTRWGFGLNLNYWMIPQIYGGDIQDQSRIGNFLEISLSAIYNIK